jgi:hypothetical protein
VDEEGRVRGGKRRVMAREGRTKGGEGRVMVEGGG